MDDLPAVEQCIDDAYGGYTELLGHKPKPMQGDYGSQIQEGIVHVAVDDTGDLQGLIVFYPRDDEMLLENVAVSSRHQGKGLGKKLIAYCEDEALRQRLKAVALFTHMKMSGNRGLYLRLGYEEIVREEDVKLDRISFRKALT
ncbi:MAG: GNAT family N-acetyltransferase [Pseudomonadota bacterium]